VSLIAIAFLVIALGLFAGYHQGVSDKSADRSVANPALDNVYTAVTDDGRFDTTAALATLISPPNLPRGHSIYITITHLDLETGNEQTVGQAYFDDDGHYVGSEVNGGLPDEAQTASRPIAISPSNGDDHGGRLTVHVWDLQ
jgi:hypothetical protein